MVDNMFDVVVYRCSMCMTSNSDSNVPCLLTMTDGDIPTKCVIGGRAEWIKLG